MNKGISVLTGFFMIVLLNYCSSNEEPDPQVTCTTDYSLQNDVMPIIETRCAISGCHNGTRFPDLRTKQSIVDNAIAIRSQVKSGRMPKNSKLNSSQIAAIVCWVDQGALDN